MAPILPDILDKAMVRPGSTPKKYQQLVPNPEYADFWESFYIYAHKHSQFQEPLPQTAQNINPYFGYFGLCFHPVTHEANYYHIGLSVTDQAKTPVLPIISGTLEYSGYSLVNGNYVMLSHPQVVTEDGFTLYTLYMHLQDLHVGFSKYQKMLREISMHRYPEIMIAPTGTLGTVGDTGIVQGLHTHLQLQCEFRNAKGVSIAVDPALLLGLKTEPNKTASVKNHQGLHEIYAKEYDILKSYGIEKYFEQDQ